MRRVVPISLFLFAACADRAEVTGPVVHSRPDFTISDAAHDAAADGRFFFLPPIVSNPPGSDGELDATLLPRLTVRVCSLSGAVCGATVATLSAIDASANAFHVVWKTRSDDLQPGVTYRIEVWSDFGLATAHRYGFADVRIVANGRDLRELEEAGFVGVVGGANLNIRFRIEKLVTRYVSMGSSIAAGFQSAGINATTQLQAYPVLLAARFGVEFNVPLLALPGCPPPFIAPITPPPPGTPPCSGRANDVLPPDVHNVAVPNVTLAEALAFPTGSTGALQALLLGPNTQVQAMQLAQPTFVSVALGDNDAFRAAFAGTLGPVAPGGPDLLTPLASFQTSYSQVVAALNAVPTLNGAVLVGVIDPVIAMPVLQPGAFAFLARDASGIFRGKPVNNNCSPVTALGQPNPLAANLISFQILFDAAFPEINCDPAAFPLGDPRRGVYILDPAEIVTLRTRVAQYNAVIAQAAATNGWAFFDPNTIVAAALVTRTAAGRTDLLRKCQDLATATTAGQFQAAVLNTCPVTGPTAAPNLFGALISFDGVHPSAAGHVVLANGIAAAINAHYGTLLPVN